MTTDPITKAKFYRAWDEGIHAYKNGKYKKAKSLFLDAADIEEKVEGEVSPAIEEYIAECALKLHENAIAKKYFEGAIEAAEHFKDKEGKTFEFDTEKEVRAELQVQKTLGYKNMLGWKKEEIDL